MIIYNSSLAKWFLNKKSYYFMLFGCCFTRFRYLEVWEYMEVRIHAKQYTECFILTLPPALGLSLYSSWWWIVPAMFTYHLLYWLEKIFRGHSSFDWEALEHCGDTLYLRKRRNFAWLKLYCRKTLPTSEWAE